MRSRIAQHAARDLLASVRTITRSPIGLFPRAAGSGVVCAAVVAGVVLSPTTAVATHRAETAHRKRAVSISVPPRLSLAPMAMRWFVPRKVALVQARVHSKSLPERSVTQESHLTPLTHLAPSQPPPAPAPTDSDSTTTPDWACIRLYESGDRFNSPTAPGGAYGFLESTWVSLGYPGWPYQASPWVQSKAALYLYNELGWQPWSTRFVCGL